MQEEQIAIPNVATPLTAVPPPLDPPMETVLGTHLPTLRHVPGVVRREFGTTLVAAIDGFVTDLSWEALHKLMCLPKLVLRAPPRSMKNAHLDVEIGRR